MKPTTQILTTLFLFFCFISNLTAKDIAQISGQITDQNAEALPFVNVALIEANGGDLITGAITDESGKFFIESSRSGQVKIVVSSIGFKTFISEEFAIEPDNSKDFGVIILDEELGALKEVTVVSSRPVIVIEADKTTVNIEGTVMAEGNSALDVIGRSPGIYVDQDGKINLNGRSGVTVMINDRQTYMSAEDLANFLRAMPAENIKSLEIINNPTSRFDAEGTAGIVNIILKKNNLDGVFGNFQAGNRYNGQNAPFGGFTINAKKEKWTNNLNLNYNEFAEFNDLEINRNFKLEEGLSRFEQESRINSRNKNFFLNGGTDYEFNKNHSVGGNLQVSSNKSSTTTDSQTEISNPGNIENSFLGTRVDNKFTGERIFANLHYVGFLDTLGTKLTTDLDFTRMNNEGNSLVKNRYWEGPFENLISNDRILNINHMDYKIFTAKVDLIRPFGEGKVLESGLKGSWVKSDNELDLRKAKEEEPYVLDPNSNLFIYQENVLAAYAMYKGKFSEKTSFQTGLRAEYSDIIGTSVTLDQVNKQKYLDFFPSAFVKHQVTKDYQVIINANRRISRPNYRLLNPFVFYIDALTTERGNPQLRPQYSHNFEMNHIFKNDYQFTFGYSRTIDIFQQIFEQDEVTRTTTTYSSNLDKSQDFNFRTMIPVEIRPWWNASNMLQANHKKWTSMIGEAKLDVSQFSYMFRTQQNLVLPKGFKVEVVGMYLGPQLFGQARIKSFGWVDAGITKSFKDEKLTMTLNGTDLFRSQIIRADIQFDQIDTSFRQYRSNQGFRLTLRYKFSKGESFRVSERSGSTEERNRLD